MSVLTTTPEPPIEVPLDTQVAPIDPNTLRDPYDPVDVNWRRWYPAGSFPPGSTPITTPQGDNEVISYVRGAKLFQDMVAAIRSAMSPYHFIALAGWNSQIHFKLDDGDDSTTLIKLLTEASNLGVVIRGLFYNHQALGLGGDNGPMVNLINSLPTGAAIHDSRHLAAGCHHQKLLVVSGLWGLVGFQGGIDLMENRRTGVHDTHTRVRGPAAVRLHQVFMERWLDHPEATGTPPIPAPQPSKGQEPKNHFVQLGRTYPNGSAHYGIDWIGPFPKGYSFAPTGKREVEAMVLHAIGQTKKFIYLEEQYLVSMDASHALAKALPQLAFVLILLCPTNLVNSERGTAVYWGRRRTFLEPLYQAAPNKVHVFEYPLAWMHSKCWIFDDRFAIIGSANVNRRGYTHDSETACGIFDVNASKRWFFAHELRMNLWAKHLGVPPLACREPVGALRIWNEVAHQRQVRPYNRTADDNANGDPRASGIKPDNPLADAGFDTFVDPYGG